VVHDVVSADGTVVDDDICTSIPCSHYTSHNTTITYHTEPNVTTIDTKLMRVAFIPAECNPTVSFLGRIQFSETGFRLNPKPVLVSE